MNPGKGGVIPPVKHRWKRGQSGNPDGRQPAGFTIREYINAFAESGATEVALRKIARDKKQPWTRRAAAERIIRTLEAPDLADFQPYLNGEVDLDALRSMGVNTEAAKKTKTKTRYSKDHNGEEVKEVEREVELFDRAGIDFDRVVSETAGKPQQTVDVTSDGEAITLLPIVLDGGKNI